MHSWLILHALYVFGLFVNLLQCVSNVQIVRSVITIRVTFVHPTTKASDTHVPSVFYYVHQCFSSSMHDRVLFKFSSFMLCLANLVVNSYPEPNHARFMLSFVWLPTKPLLLKFVLLEIFAKSLKTNNPNETPGWNGLIGG